jgi:hypothetical protein
MKSKIRSKSKKKMRSKSKSKRTIQIFSIRRPIRFRYSAGVCTPSTTM